MMDSQVAKTSQSHTIAKEMRNQTKLVMLPNWEHHLTPVPLSIAILGELVYISSEIDFSINTNPPNDGYKFIKYPETFCGSLMHLCNSGWGAFNEAHTNMDQIRLHTMAVPNYMKNVKDLFQESDEVIKAHLPDQLENIRRIADDCLALAQKTETRFTDVIGIIQELLEACINAGHFHGEKLEAIKKKLEENELRKQSAEEAVRRSERVFIVMEEELKEARERYQKAMDSLPSGWGMVGMDLVGAITQNFTTLVIGLMAVMTQPVPQMCNASKAISKTTKDVECSSPCADAVDEINIYSKSAEILTCAEIFLKFVGKNNIDWKNLYDQKKKAANTDFLKDQFQRIKSSLDKFPECEPRTDAQELCEEGIDICKELEAYAPDGKCEENKTKELTGRIRKLTQSACTFDCNSKDITQSPLLYPEPQMLLNEDSQSGCQSASQKATKNSRFRIEQSRAQLSKIRQTYEKSVENMEENQKELTEILNTLRSCELKEIDFNTTIKMLVKGMDALSTVKVQWEKMVRFFQMVSNIVKTSLTRTLKDFASTSEKTQTLSYSARLFSKDLLYLQASQATNIANLVHMISATYTEVSDRYLMDAISSVGTFGTMDRKKPEFARLRLRFQNSCDEAQKAILDHVLQNKTEFERNAASKLEKIDQVDGHSSL